MDAGPSYSYQFLNGCNHAPKPAHTALCKGNTGVAVFCGMALYWL